MPVTKRQTKIPEKDVEKVRALARMKIKNPIQNIANIYGCNEKTVNRFINKHIGSRFTSISDQRLAEIVHEEQQGRKQTHGRSKLIAKLASRNGMMHLKRFMLFQS